MQHHLLAAVRHSLSLDTGDFVDAFTLIFDQLRHGAVPLDPSTLKGFLETTKTSGYDSDPSF